MEGAATAMQVAALREEMEGMRRELAAAKLAAATSEAQRAELEGERAADQRRTTAGASVRQEQRAQAGTFTTVNHTRSAPTPKFDGSKDA